jgi:hypothetical protein
MYEFTYVGGARKPTVHTLEKFMLFILIGDKETPFWQLFHQKQLTQIMSKQNTYLTMYNMVKIFLSVQGFGIRKQYLSLYIQLGEEYPALSVRSFVDNSNFIFSAQGKLLKRKEVESIVKDSVSLSYYLKQPDLSISLLQKLITINRSVLKKNTRTIRIRQ